MARLFNVLGDEVAQIDGDYHGEKIKFRDVIYKAVGWIVPGNDVDGRLRYFRYAVPAPETESIVEIEDDGRQRLTPKTTAKVDEVVVISGKR